MKRYFVIYRPAPQTYYRDDDGIRWGGVSTATVFPTYRSAEDAVKLFLEHTITDTILEIRQVYAK